MDYTQSSRQTGGGNEPYAVLALGQPDVLQALVVVQTRRLCPVPHLWPMAGQVIMPVQNATAVALQECALHRVDQPLALDWIERL